MAGERRERRKPGRNSDVEKVRIVAAVLDYLGKAEADPEKSLTYDAIAEETGVSRRHLSNTADPDYADLVAKIIALRGRRAGLDDKDEPAAVSVASPFADSGLSDAALAARTEERVTELARLMREWLSRHGRAPSAADAPLALHDLDVLLGRLHREAADVRPLVRERTRRVDVAHHEARRASRLGAGSSLNSQMTIETADPAS
jgi:AraC-like DNA-binding protein